MTEDLEYWYRIEDQRWSVTIDPEREICGTRFDLRTMNLEVIKHTPKGVWLKLFDGNRRFVLREVGKKYACPTLKEALESYIARKGRQISIYQARIRRAEEMRAMAKHRLNDGPEDFLG